MPVRPHLPCQSRSLGPATGVQVLLLILVLGATLCLPRPGSAMLIVPIAARPMRLPPDLAVLRSGWPAGSLLVRARGAIPYRDLLAGGMIPLAAPTWLCGSGTPQRFEQEH